MKTRGLCLLAGWVIAFLLGVGLCKQPSWGPLDFISRALTSIELDSYDRRAALLPRREPDPRVVIVAIDVESLDEFGAMPWDRAIHARLIEQLSQAGVGVVALDIAFAGQRRDLSGQELEQDRALVRAMQASQKVVVARYVDLIQRYDAHTGEARIQRRIHNLPPEMLAALEGKRGIGLAFCSTDPDHAIRTTWLRASPEDFGGQAGDGINRIDYVPLAAQALEKSSGDKLEIARMAEGWQAFFGSGTVPVWREAPILLLDFPGRPFPVYSYRDVLAGKVEASAFAGKVVIVGTTCDLADSFSVPRNPAGIRGPVPGCFVHATLADQLLSNHFLKFANYPLEGQHASPWLMGYLWGALLALFSLAAHHRFRLAPALKLSGALALAYALAAAVAMVWGRTYLNLVVPLAMLGTAQLPVLAYELWQVRAVLRWFVPQEHVESLMRSEGLAGESQTQIATILFVDIRDYTTLSEVLNNPGDVRALVSQFHTITAQVFERFGGYVCDFQGDAQMVAFGVNPKDPQHASKAIASAAELPEAVEKLNLRLAQAYPQFNTDGKGVFRYGVGICTGEVSVGYLQGGGKLQHTVLGDTTNTAARLQGLARDLGVITVVSHTAAGLAPQWKDRLRPLPAAKLKGKAEAHAIFELT